MPSYIEITPDQHNSGAYKIKDAIRDIDPGGTIVMRSGVYLIDHWDDMDTVPAGDGWPNNGIATAMRIQKAMTIRPEAGGWAEVAYAPGSHNTPYWRCAFTVGYESGPWVTGTVTVGSTDGSRLYFSVRDSSAPVRAAVWAKRLDNLAIRHVTFMTSIGDFYPYDEVNSRSQVFLDDISGGWIINDCDIPILNQYEGVRSDYIANADLRNSRITRYRPIPDNKMGRDVNLSGATSFVVQSNTFQSNGYASIQLSIGGPSNGNVNSNLLYGPGAAAARPVAGSMIAVHSNSANIEVAYNTLYNPESNRVKEAIALYDGPRNINIHHNRIEYTALIGGLLAVGIGIGYPLGDSLSSSSYNTFVKLDYAYIVRCCFSDSNYITASKDTLDRVRYYKGLLSPDWTTVVPNSSNCADGGWGCMSFDRIRNP